MTPQPRAAVAALASLIVLQAVMLLALYAKVEPHPPATIPLFGIAPFLGAALAAATAALIIGPARGLSGRGLSLSAAAMALGSFGPQKYFDAQFPTIWPAVLAGQIAAAVVIYVALRAALTRRFVQDAAQTR
ncbi:MAG: hypothetical protein ACOY4R_08930 [Pseudomonadota bacterium]